MKPVPVTLATMLTVFAVAMGSDRAATGEAPFLADTEAAMARMMTGMDVKPSGEVDQDFAAMMIPHHQGAIDMAVAELRYGSNEQLRRIAQEIIVDQQSEIAAMDIAIGRPAPASAPVPTAPMPTHRVPGATP